jgi:prophage maintenance system killer protein
MKRKYWKVSERKIVASNKKFGGILTNKSPLNFAVESAIREKSIYRSNAILVRGIIVYHPFLDGNKRTTVETVAKRFAEQGIKCDVEALTRNLINIAKNNISDINKIERKLRKCTSKK